MRITQEVLREVASLQDLPGSRMVSPFEWYYTSSKILPLWDEQCKVCVVVLPIIASTNYEGFKIETILTPVSNSNTTVKLMASNCIALDIKSYLVVELQQCQGKQQVACNPSPIGKDATHKNCTHTIILGDEVTAA